ncbi:MAG: lipid-A-disaccharide synthase N-terminal domain-containing protein [Flavobacteriaceae bacterium]|nr:lipid-A-disaccharide synthase N-terminal domain-containing protein [Flavobacteriaceae bacterium]
MNDYFVYTIGLIAQILFSIRLLVQWISSEKEKKVVAPTLFWSISLIASLLLFIYGYLRNDFAIMLGQFIMYYIYIRNLQLQYQWRKIQKGIRIFFICFPITIFLITSLQGAYDITQLFNKDHISSCLLVLGIVSQLVFTFRFIYQWIYSERIKTSVLPAGFWIISLLGAILILIYAIFRKDPILFMGQIFGLLVYIRNLMILKRH